MKSVRPRLTVSTAALVTLLAALAASAEPYALGHAQLPRQKTVNGTPFALQGAGFLRAGLIFKVYGAALYLGNEEHAQRVLDDDVPKRLEIFYLHKTPRDAMIEAAEEALAKNVPGERLKKLRPLVDRLHDAYRDMTKGETAAMTHIPGEGMEFAVNGERLLLLEDNTFAGAYLTVWLGNEPSSRSVKKQLLEKAP